MKSSIDLKQIQNRVSRYIAPIAKRHVILSFIMVVGFMIFTIYSIDQILHTTTDMEYDQRKQAEAINTRFDNNTIEKINQLKSRSQDNSLVIPEGRRNPFIE